MDTDFSFKAIKMFWNLIKVVATYCECKRMYTLKCLIFLLCQFYLQKKKNDRKSLGKPENRTLGNKTE